MKHLFATWIIIFFSLQVLAQDWQCIKTDGEYIYGFEYTSENILDETIRIDSIYNSLGYTYFLNHVTMRHQNCYNPFSYTFLGEQIFSDNNGNYHFINTYNDTLHVKSDALLNESWIFYSSKVKNLRIWATVDTILAESFSGLTDSVKIIRFSAQDTSEININHPINLKNIKLSKHYGFIEVLGFDQCPENLYGYTLLGIGPEKKGYLNFGDREIWDIQPGDEFHKRKAKGGSSPYGYNKDETEFIMKVIDKWGNYDTALYLKYHVQSRELKETVRYYEYSNHFDTVYPPYIFTQVIRFNDPERQKWNTIPGESTFFKEFTATYKIRTSVDSLYQEKSYEGPQYKRISDSCYQENYLDLVGSIYCIKGAGDNYYYLNNPFAGHYYTYESNRLLYYNKGERIWGTPLIFSDSTGNLIDSSIAVYPNPVEETLFFNLHNVSFSTLSICIFNSDGSRIMEVPVTSQTVNLDVKDLKPGIYFYRMNSTRIKGTGKFIVK